MIQMQPVVQPEQQKKKSIKPKLVMIVMFVLALFIALPPIFRVLFPKNVIDEDEGGVVVKLLSCDRFSVAEGKRITSVITYEDNIAVRNAITYADYVMTPDALSFVRQPSIPVKSVNDEINYFVGLESVSVSIGATVTSVTLTSESLAANPDDTELSNYLLDSDSQKQRYEAQGFICAFSGD